MSDFQQNKALVLNFQTELDNASGNGITDVLGKCLNPGKPDPVIPDHVVMTSKSIRYMIAGHRFRSACFSTRVSSIGQMYGSWLAPAI